MPRSLKLTLVTAGALLGLLSLVALAVLLLVNESRLEAVASKALGMDVDIGGRGRVSLFPSLHVSLEDVHIRNRGMDLISAEQADFGLDPLPLLLAKVRFRHIALERYRISIERGVDGKFNYQPEDEQRELAPVDLVNVSLTDGTLHYADRQSGKGLEVTDCNLDATHLSHPGGKPSGLLTRLSITMDFACAAMQKDNLVWSDLRGSLEGNDGIFEFEPVTMLVFGGQGSGSVRVDRTAPVPGVQVRYSLREFHVEEFLKMLSPDEVAHGSMDMTMNLTMQGSTRNELLQTAQGDISLVGQNLTLDNWDLDGELSRYESSQRFNLVDVGALFLAGPLGVVATKGYGFASLFRGSGGATRIPTLIAEWEVERGVAYAKDVALATSEHRLALEGGLDLVNEEFDDVIVALVDSDGCAQVRQRILGPFAKPVVEKPNFLKSIAGPGIKLFKQIKGLFPGKKCEVFYEGSVAPPEQPED